MRRAARWIAIFMGITACGAADVRCDPTLSCALNTPPPPTSAPAPPCAGAACDVMGIAAGDRHTCAWLRGGDVYCWGANDRGQSRPWSAGVPLPYLSRFRIGGLTVDGVTAGRFHTCLWGHPTVSGTFGRPPAVYCWGSNATRMLSPERIGGLIGIDRFELDPISVRGELDGGLPWHIEHVSAGAMTTFAITPTGTEAWGAPRALGLLGEHRWHLDRGVWARDGSLLREHARVLSAAGFRACGIVDGAARCEDRTPPFGAAEQEPEDPSPLTFETSTAGATDLVTIATSATHTCGLDRMGRIFCFGDNSDGQLGVPSIARSDAFQRVEGHGSAVALCTGAAVDIDPSRGDAFVVHSLGPSHTCALEETGSVWCWGANREGQLGDGTTRSRSSPAQVRDLPRARAIACGGRHTCALTEDGAVYCWGRNFDGELGVSSTALASSSAPRRVSALPRP